MLCLFGQGQEIGRVVSRLSYTIFILLKLSSTVYVAVVWARNWNRYNRYILQALKVINASVGRGGREKEHEGKSKQAGSYCFAAKVFEQTTRREHWRRPYLGPLTTQD